MNIPASAPADALGEQDAQGHRRVHVRARHRAERIGQREQDEPEHQGHAQAPDRVDPVHRRADPEKHQDERADQLGRYPVGHVLPPVGCPEAGVTIAAVITGGC